MKDISDYEGDIQVTFTYMETEVLCYTDSLADEYPSLRETVDRTQERRHEEEALHVLDLHARMTDVLQNQGPNEGGVTLLCENIRTGSTHLS